MSTPTDWVKATASGSGGNCVEQRRAEDGMVEVRDTKDRAGPTLRFTAAEYAAWLDAARRGEFDHLA